MIAPSFTLLFRAPVGQRCIALAALALLVGCRSESPPFDLAANLPLAEVRTPTTEIDVGSREGRAYMISGWSHDESLEGASYVWGLGKESSLQWFVDEPRDLSLQFRCWSFRPARADPQRLTILVNGWALPPVSVVDWPAVYTVSLPAAALNAGWNTITLRYSQYVALANDPRPVAVAWDWLRASDPRPDREPPQASGEGDSSRLWLPTGSRLDYFVVLRPGVELVIDGIEAYGRAQVLEVEIKGANHATARRFSLAAGPRTVLPLPVDAPQAARVSLRARPLDDADFPQSPGLELRRPILGGGNGPVGLPRHDGNHHGAVATARSEKPNVIVYLIDTLRADHLGCYGYDRDTSPAIDRFARDAVHFTRAVAQSSWTRSSVASIFTGLRPDVHGALDVEDPLSDEAVTLAELLRQAGYETAGFITNGNISSFLNFAQGFDVYEEIERGEQPVRSDEVNARVFSWLAKRRGDRPLFLYVHTIDPHAPYTPPEAYRERFAADVDPAVGEMAFMEKLKNWQLAPTERIRRHMLSLYDGEVAFNDASFGAFVEELRRIGLYDSSLIVLVSDHGEEFLDHGWWQHAETLYEEQLRVPLVIRFPNGWRSGTKASFIAQHTDLLPTIVAHVTGKELDRLQGENLLPFLDGSTRPPPRTAISYLEVWDAQIESIAFEDSKLVRNLGRFTIFADPPEQMFDLAADPGEQRNLAYVQRTRTGLMRSLLARERRNGFTALEPEAVVLPDSVKEQLRALGYQP